MQKHHTVQSKYLTQWRMTELENQLNIYLIPENEYIKRGPGWKGFWKKNYNIFDNDQKKFYLPENVAELIDAQGIEVIRNINCDSQGQLDWKNRSILAFYIALQYIRTPRFREETNKFMEENIKFRMRKDISSPDKFKITKEDILKHKPTNKQEKEALEKISAMTEEEINKQSFDFLHSNNFHIKLTNAGHSKQILKIDRLAKKLFEFQWLFLIAPRDTSFATSDNPCFTASPTKMFQGLLSPHVTVFFPLRPDICITIKPKFKSKKELFLKLDKKEVKNINKLILENSYQCLIAKDRKHLENLTKNFDYKNHKKSRDTVVYKNGDYVMFNVE